MQMSILRQAFLALVLAILTVALPKVAHAGEKRPIIFEPVPSPITRSYFANGQPFAIVTTDSALVMLAMDPATLSRYYDYIRVWCLYYSTASEPILLDPSKMATVVTTNIKKGKSQELTPEPPTAILKLISDEMANKEILQAIGGVLAAAGQAMTVQPTRIVGGGNAAGTTWTVNDYDEKQRAAGAEVGRRTAAAMNSTRTAYELYSQSVSAGILRRNTVFSGCSVNGYIYFPATSKSSDSRHMLKLRLPNGEVEVAFNPAAGE